MLVLTPFKQPDDSLCGPSVCKMILDYYGIQVSIQELATLCNHTYELGCTNEDMARCLESFDLIVHTKLEATLEDIKTYLDSSTPVMVDWFSSGVSTGLADAPNGHASIVVHLDSLYIYLMDPEYGGIRQLKIEDFMRCWFDWKEPIISCDPSNLVIRQLMVATK